MFTTSLIYQPTVYHTDLPVHLHMRGGKDAQQATTAPVGICPWKHVEFGVKPHERDKEISEQEG